MSKDTKTVVKNSMGIKWICYVLTLILIVAKIFNFCTFSWLMCLAPLLLYWVVWVVVIFLTILFFIFTGK